MYETIFEAGGVALTFAIFTWWAKYCGLRPSKYVPTNMLVWVVGLAFSKGLWFTSQLPKHSSERLPMIAAILISAAGLMLVVRITALREMQQAKLQSTA
jgi:hypothetical protein